MTKPLWENVLGALEYLHGQGIIHRDVKPENILIGENKFMLTDFGISMSTEEVTRTAKGGTMFFMAPEVTEFVGGTVPESDIWSFGITMGCALGYWCVNEMYFSTEQWTEKLRSMGYTKPYTESPYAGDVRDAQVRRWQRRVLRLVQYELLPPAFSHMLVAAQHRSSPTACLTIPIQYVAPSRDDWRNNFNARDDGPNWHMHALGTNQMSYDILKGGYHYTS